MALHGLRVTQEPGRAFTMTTLDASAGADKADFHEVAASFLDQPGRKRRRKRVM